MVATAPRLGCGPGASTAPSSLTGADAGVRMPTPPVACAVPSRGSRARTAPEAATHSSPGPVLDLHADRGLGPLHHRPDRPGRQQMALARWHGYHRLQTGVTHQRAMPRSPEPQWTTTSLPCRRSPATAGRARWRASPPPCGRGRRPARPRCEHSCRVTTGSPSEAGASGRTHASTVLRRARGTGDRRIDKRAPADHLATRPKQCVDVLQEGHGEVVALEEVAEAQGGGGVRDAGDAR